MDIEKIQLLTLKHQDFQALLVGQGLSASGL